MILKLVYVHTNVVGSVSGILVLGRKRMSRKKDLDKMQHRSALMM